jgi:uncharacterized membrane protein YhaH (DUF805 family)
MLGFMFGFNARLGRLHYFLACIGLCIALGIGFVALAFGVALVAPNQPGVVRWTVIVMLALLFWSSVMLQAMRFRDIGWDPVCMVPAWIAMSIVDHTVAVRFPEWSLLATHAGTIVGALVNIALTLVLLFWPSGASDDASPDDGAYRARNSRGPAVIPEARLARASSGDVGRRTW